MLTAILNYLFQSYLEVAVKKLLTLFVFLFIPLIAILFVQCNEPVIEPTDQDIAYKPNDHGNGVGGGGGTELTNNLSLPGFLADGYLLPALPEGYTTLPVWTIPYLEQALRYYAQKVEGNIWRAYNAAWTPDDVVTYIDWGDNIESVNPKLKYTLQIRNFSVQGVYCPNDWLYHDFTC